MGLEDFALGYTFPMQITLRKATPADAAGIARVRIDTWRDTYRGIVPDETLARMDYGTDAVRFQGYIADERTFFYIALNEAEEVIGFAGGGAERDGLPGYPGEVYAIYILPTFQKAGIGRGLIRTAFEDLMARGLFPAVIWALEENPACAFYRRIGGVEVGRKTTEIGGRVLVELGFGYSDPNI